MPIYEVKNLHTGKVEEHFRPIARRDCWPPHLKRLFTPPRRGFITGADADESPEKRVPIAFRTLEETSNWRKIEHDTGFSRDEIRRVWNF